MTVGAKPCRFSSFLSSFTAAALSRCRRTSTSSTSPSLSTARHIYMRRVMWRWSPAPQVARYERPELQHPSTDRLIADLQPALGLQIFDIPIGQHETQIKPDRPPYHSGGKRWRAYEIGGIAQP